MQKLEIIINEMMADDGPVPMGLGNVGMHDARTTQSDLDASNDMSHDDECAIAWKWIQSWQRKEQARKDRTEQERGTEGKELMNGRVAKEMMEERREARKASKGSRS